MKNKKNDQPVSLFTQFNKIGIVNSTTIDWASAKEKIKSHLVSELAELSKHDEFISKELEIIFNQLGGKAVTLPAITGLVAQRMFNSDLITMDQFALAKGRADSYIREHADRYEIKRGQNGGVKRIIATT